MVMTEIAFAPDLKDAALYEQGIPHQIFARLRQQAPVYWNPETDGPGFWAITKYDDIVEISRNPQLFSSASAHGGHRIFNENEVSIANSGETAIGIPLISLDPPLHQKYRVLAMRGVTPSRLAGIEERIVERATSLLDAIATPASVEFVSAFSAPLPLLTLCELIDVPSTMWRQLYDWTNCLVGEDDPEFRQSPAELAAVMSEFLAFARTTFDSRRQQPGEDILSILATADINGEPITFRDFVGNLVLVLVGANETTRNSISHSMVAFAENPEQWQKLRDNPELIGSAVREMVRYANPVFHMRRTALADTVIRGQAIRKGDKVVMWYISANRDEDKFSEPYRFNIERADSPHLGFGSGQHICLGSRLAEMQLRIVLRLMLERYSTIHVLQPPRRVRSNFINGLKDLYLQLELAPGAGQP